MLNTAELNRDKVMGRQRTAVAKSSTPRVQARNKISPHSRPFPKAKPSPLADATQSNALSQNAERSQTATPIMAKLTVGAVGDKYEKEADAVASQVVQQLHGAGPPPVQRDNNDGDDNSIQRQLLGGLVQRNSGYGEEENQTVQMKPMVQLKGASAGGAASPELEQSIQRKRGKGQTLRESLRNPLENAFGADFSGVRIHTDNTADQLNQSIQAKAFTTGQDVFFRQGAYAPESKGGQELIAHELTHVVQQGNGSLQRYPMPTMSISTPQSQTQTSIQRVENEQKTNSFDQQIKANKAKFKEDRNSFDMKMKKAGLSLSDLESYAIQEFSRETFDFMNAYGKILDTYNGNNADKLVLGVMDIHLRYVETGAGKEVNLTSEVSKKCAKVYKKILTVNQVPDPSKLSEYIAALGTAWLDVVLNVSDTMSRAVTIKKTGRAGVGQTLKKGIYNDVPEYVKEGKSNIDNYVTNFKESKDAIKEETYRQDVLNTLGQDPTKKRKRHGQNPSTMGTSRRRQ